MLERSSAQSGKDAELQALNYLQQQGLRLLAQNWLCTVSYTHLRAHET